PRLGTPHVRRRSEPLRWFGLRALVDGHRPTLVRQGPELACHPLALRPRGPTGPSLAQPILDEYLHNTFFVVAHFHLVMAMAGIFGLFCATYYWFPLIFRLQLSEALGKLHFWLTLFFAYNTFLPMHITGLAGEPRHYAQLTGLTPA